ncbi:MAG: ATP-binding protein, partial [Oligoflexia bacterium]|nr:ATP-binding protein [Oligoflexia bacterium]
GLANKAGVVLVRVLPTGSLCVMGDRDRLLQVLTNLVGNAVKFSPRGGRVLLSLSRRDDRAVFSVSDEGPGISAEFRSHVFTPFSQADASDRRSAGGTGLGLSIAKAIVDAHDGRIWFENGDGSGTTFCFDLEITTAFAKGGAPS